MTGVFSECWSAFSSDLLTMFGGWHELSSLVLFICSVHHIRLLGDGDGADEMEMMLDKKIGNVM